MLQYKLSLGYLELKLHRPTVFKEQPETYLVKIDIIFALRAWLVND